MDCFEYAIVGSGPAGVAAARRMPGARTCLIDVGERSSNEFPHATLISALQQGDTQALLGRHWEMLANLAEPNCLHPKQRSAALRFVMQGEPFEVRGSSGKTVVYGAGSYAAGGMSNIWGAQLLRYTDADLMEAGGWPLDASTLEPYYTDLEAHIGISGLVDDMHGFLGGSEPTMSPVSMVPAAQQLYDHYLLRKKKLSKSILLLGRARLAISTQSGHNRPTHILGETDFFSDKQPGLYTARDTLGELISENQITYLGGYRLMGWNESDTHVELELLNLSNNQKRRVCVRHLLLGCGTIQTAKMVLNHHNELGRTLPFLDHPPTLLPVFIPSMFGSALPECSFPIQLIATIPGSKYGNMISFYYPGGLLWSDFLPEIPLPMSASVRMMGALLGGMLVAQIWETAQPCADNRLRLDGEGNVVIDYPHRPTCAVLSQLLRSLRSLKAYSLKRFATFSPPGWGFHHAGCLPMRVSPDAYETHMDGRLWNSKRVRVIDGSVLPSLPAKNHTLTLMANAARIADKVQQCGY